MSEMPKEVWLHKTWCGDYQSVDVINFDTCTKYIRADLVTSKDDINREGE